jgi:hypothetical protein
LGHGLGMSTDDGGPQMSTETAPAYVEPPAEAGTGAASQRVDASLTFRLGVADTTYAQHGELHVLSRLALEALSGLDVDSGVTVGTVTTRFGLAGDPSEVLRALDALAAWVRDPSWAAIDEVVEAVRREGGDGLEGIDDELRNAVLARWGRDGVGLLGCAPHCGYAASVERLDAWRSRFLTAGNVVLAGAWEQLADHELALPAGPLVPVPEDRPLPLVLPAWRRSPGLEPATVLTALTEDAAATRLLSGLVTRELNAHRDRTGGHPRSRTRALPVGDRLLWLYTRGGGTPARLLDALGGIADGSVAAVDVEAVVSASPAGPASPSARAESTALVALLGMSGLRPVEEVTHDELVAEARRAISTLLVLADDLDDVLELPEAGPPPLPDPGPVLHRYHGRRSRDELTITTNTCERRSGEVREVVAWDQLVGVHRVEHDVRRLVPRDGSEMWIDTHDWRHGRHALGMVDGHVSDDRVVHEPDPYDVLHANDRKPWQDPSLVTLLVVGLAVLAVVILLGVWLGT